MAIKKILNIFHALSMMLENISVLLPSSKRDGGNGEGDFHTQWLYQWNIDVSKPLQQG